MQTTFPEQKEQAKHHAALDDVYPDLENVETDVPLIIDVRVVAGSGEFDHRSGVGVARRKGEGEFVIQSSIHRPLCP